MRRIVKGSFPLLAILLAACSSTPTTVATLPSEEVLSKSAAASRSLQSAEFSGSFSFDADMQTTAPSLSGSAEISGVLQDSGNDVHILLRDGVLKGAGEMGGFNSTLDAQMISMGPGDVYIRVDSLQSDSESFLSPSLIDQITGAWWRIPTNAASDDVVPITPDPSLLRAQAEVVQVVSDDGVGAIEGFPVYQYTVTVDKEKLVSYLRTAAQEQNEQFNEEEVRASLDATNMNGKIAIDAKSFFVRRVEWDIERESDGASMHISFTLLFRNHNEAAEIEPPQNAQDFSPVLFLGGSMPLPVLDAMPDAAGDNPFMQLDSMSPEQQQEFLRQMVESGNVPGAVQ